ncbi:NlpC/P60 family protein [Actinophytocola sp.]|uniref:NlpC/P60 family protein n=1 Tax=Actinophytocola sp. TaxID=1872138 RepID=UPI002D80FAA6|nr:NlpC/P60 family protein [Actinophytocola sp.]HET9144149.1 NlpC/P60 family protein [Actinophytocola sp.]
MTTLTAAQVAVLVKQAGFPESDWVTMVAVCKAESGFRVEAKNPSSSASGLFQILWSVHKQYDQRKLLSDAAYNTKAAYDIYKSQGKRAWVAYTSGAYQKYMNEARQGVAQAANVTGNPSLPGSSGTANGDSGTTPAVTYGPLGPEATKAGVGTPLAAAEETATELAGLRILGSEIAGDFSSVIIGSPTYQAAVDTVPHVTFTIADPEGELLWQARNLWVQGTRVQYRDLDLRIDEMKFEPGSHGTGQLTVTCIDDMVYALMKLRGPRTAEGQSATSWIWTEMFQAGLRPSLYFLGEAVPTQSVIARDAEDQSGTGGSGEIPSAWTTIVRLAKELGKRVFISGRRLVFGSSAFAMQWTAPGPLRLSWHAPPTEGERFLTMPSARYVSIGSRSDVVQVTARIPLNRAQYFRPGVPVMIRNTPSVAANDWITFMCTSISHNLGTDTDGAEITLTLPVDPPPQPPTQTTSAGANGGSTSSGSSASGGGADGQVGQFVALALQQAGKRYVFGAEASVSDPNPRAFDCSELVEWAAARAGINPRVPDGSAAQLAHCKSKGTLISVQQGINTKGALLFMPGHVAISLGNGKTIEAMNPSQGVRQGNANNRGWTAAGRIPGAQGY